MESRPLTLYAQWEEHTYTITYNPNGGQGVRFSSKPFIEDATVTIEQNNFTKAGEQFRRWTTEADGSGTSYTENQEIIMPGKNIELYAQWENMFYHITYFSNDGKENIVAKSHEKGTEVTIESNSFASPAGKRFRGWNEKADGSGKTYSAGYKMPMPFDNIELYAIWDSIKYNVSYNLNGGKGILPSRFTKNMGDRFYAIANVFAPPKDKKFVEWNTRANGTGKTYRAGAAVIMPNESITLYAQWRDVVLYNLKYHLNDKTNSTIGNGEKIPEDTKFNILDIEDIDEQENKDFVQWNTQADGKGEVYAAGAEFIMPEQDVNLYAIWQYHSITITLDPQEGMIDDITKEVVPYDNYGDLPSPMKDDHIFKGWFFEENGDGKQVTSKTTVETEEPHTLFAQWTEIVIEPIDTNTNNTGNSTSKNNANNKNSTASKKTTTTDTIPTNSDEQNTANINSPSNNNNENKDEAIETIEQVKNNSPYTGDERDIKIWLLLSGLSLFLIVALTAIKLSKKKRGRVR